ncbi:MAG: hypothetical protein WB800_10410 [Streptosporangiaceae bacterium]
MTMRILSWPAKGRRPRGVLLATAAGGIAGLLAAFGPLSASGATADAHGGQRPWFLPGNLVLSGSYYTGQADLFTPGVTELPPGCTGSGCTAAVADGSYPYVFNNDASDPSFGVTSPVFLDQITPDGRLVNVLRVPDGNGPGGTRADHVVTSFSSKSELALNLSTDGRDLTFMGYYATPNTVDASNANTPGAIDPTNPVTSAYYRVAAEVNQSGRISYTLTNAYSGDNGRAAILNNSGGDNVLYMAGNAGNGSNPQPDGIISGTGAQITTPQRLPETGQTPGATTPVGSFNVTQLGDPIDKIGKDTNFRGLTVYNNVVYYTKGSGSNGINTVYFIDTTGKACPSGVGVPQPGARLPTSPIDYNPALLQSEGVTPYNMCILKGFPTTLAKSASEDAFPFGLFFANADTVYVADEGNGTATYDPATGSYAAAAAQTTAGLQKWVFNGTQWSLAYTLSTGLNLGQPYSVAGYPTGDNAATGLPWAPATDGLRNITGRVNPNGTVTIWAVTSTVSGSGDQGADPNKLVAITDKLSAAALPAGEQFATVRSAGYGEVLRGVSFTPGSSTGHSLGS